MDEDTLFRTRQILRNDPKSPHSVFSPHRINLIKVPSCYGPAQDVCLQHYYWFSDSERNHYFPPITLPFHVFCTPFPQFDYSCLNLALVHFTSARRLGNRSIQQGWGRVPSERKDFSGCRFVSRGFRSSVGTEWELVLKTSSRQKYSKRHSWNVIQRRAGEGDLLYVRDCLKFFFLWKYFSFKCENYLIGGHETLVSTQLRHTWSTPPTPIGFITFVTFGPTLKLAR